MPKFILSPQHPVGFHRFSDCFFIFRLSVRIQSPYLFRLNVRDLLQLRRIRFRAVLCFSRAALLICSESDTSLNNYISCQANGKVHSLSAMNNALTKLCVRNGLPAVTVHGLRHMFATILVEQGVPLVKISGLLGHSSVNTTFEYYCDVMDEKEKIIAFMNDAFAPEGREGTG